MLQEFMLAICIPLLLLLLALERWAESASLLVEAPLPAAFRALKCQIKADHRPVAAALATARLMDTTPQSGLATPRS